jgi:hypothetical protein
MPAELHTETRLCRTCCQPKPLAEFRRRSPNSDARFRECRACHAAAERRRRQAAKSRTDREVVAKTVQAVARDRNCHRIEFLVQRAANACGGFDRLAAEFHRQFEAAQRRPGGPSSLLAMTALLNLLRHMDARQPASDRSVAERIVQLICDQPQQFAAVLRQQGWTAIPQ